MKLGILGAGHIGDLTAPTLAALPEIECAAVASRSLQKAQAFAAKYGFARAYGSYEELLCDPEIELVYVATPHSHHYQHAMQALEHGKPVLCEKAFTLNVPRRGPSARPRRKRGSSSPRRSGRGICPPAP